MSRAARHANVAVVRATYLTVGGVNSGGTWAGAKGAPIVAELSRADGAVRGGRGAQNSEKQGNQYDAGHARQVATGGGSAAGARAGWASRVERTGGSLPPTRPVGAGPVSGDPLRAV